MYLGVFGEPLRVEEGGRIHSRHANKGKKRGRKKDERVCIRMYPGV